MLAHLLLLAMNPAGFKPQPLLSVFYRLIAEIIILYNITLLAQSDEITTFTSKYF